MMIGYHEGRSIIHDSKALRYDKINCLIWMKVPRPERLVTFPFRLTLRGLKRFDTINNLRDNIFMKKITLQDIFDAAWQAFVIEGKPPASDGPSCMYLTNDGRKCAIGLVLPDGHPAQKSGCGEVSFLVKEYPELWADEISKVDIDVFQGCLHDDLIDFDSGTWKEGYQPTRRISTGSERIY